MKTTYRFRPTKPLEFRGNTVRQSSRRTGSSDPRSELGAAWPERHGNSWKTEHLIKNNHKDSLKYFRPLHLWCWAEEEEERAPPLVIPVVAAACSTDRWWMGRSMMLFWLSSTAWLILVMQHLNQRYYWWQKIKKNKKNAWNGLKENVHCPQQEKTEADWSCFWRLPVWWAHLWGDFRWSLRGKKHFFFP